MRLIRCFEDQGQWYVIWEKSDDFPQISLFIGSSSLENAMSFAKKEATNYSPSFFAQDNSACEPEKDRSDPAQTVEVRRSILKYIDGLSNAVSRFWNVENSYTTEHKMYYYRELLSCLSAVVQTNPDVFK